MRRLVPLLLLSVLLVQCKATFDSQMPTTARGIVGQKLRVPCGIKDYDSDRDVIKWKAPGRRTIKAVQDANSPIPYRIFMVEETLVTGLRSWTLTFEPLRKEDEGEYTCVQMSASDGTYDFVKYNISVLDSTEGLNWDLSLRCGFSNYINGEPGECDSEGTYPCCSPAGWCGYTQAHCDCISCKDFRKASVPDDDLPWFDDRTPTTARAILGKDVSLPCTPMKKITQSPTWMKKDDFTGQDVILYSFQGFPTDKRFSTSYSDYRNTYTIIIEDVRLSDAGSYVCQFFDGNQEHRREIYLTVLDSPEGLKWSSSLRCGNTEIINGKPAECDPLGAYPCCSPADWCGNTVNHCNCAECIDFRNATETSPSELPCSPPFWKINDRCIAFIPEVTFWPESLEICQKMGGNLLTFDSLTDLQDASPLFEQLGLFNADFWIGLTNKAIDELKVSGDSSSEEDAGILSPMATKSADDQQNWKEYACLSVTAKLSSRHSIHTDCNDLKIPLCES